MLRHTVQYYSARTGNTRYGIFGIIYIKQDLKYNTSKQDTVSFIADNVNMLTIFSVKHITLNLKIKALFSEH